MNQELNTAQEKVEPITLQEMLMLEPLLFVESAAFLRAEAKPIEGVA